MSDVERDRQALERLIVDDLNHRARHLISSTRTSHAHLLAGLIVTAGYRRVPGADQARADLAAARERSAADIETVQGAHRLLHDIHPAHTDRDGCPTCDVIQMLSPIACDLPRAALDGDHHA